MTVTARRWVLGAGNQPVAKPPEGWERTSLHAPPNACLIGA
jgi:hypothetical protein